MARRAIDFKDFAKADKGATTIAEQYCRWKDARTDWEKLKRELRQYVFQTDTTRLRTKLPWMNTTTRPKLCQIRDNLHSNYISALSLSSNFLRWQAGTEDDATKDKAQVLTAYVRSKMDDSDADAVISQLLFDYIDYGIAIAGIEYVTLYNTDEDGNKVVVYSGPRVIRYNPDDVVFDITAPDFVSAPKITRSVVTLGDLKRIVRDYPEYEYDEAAINKLLENRQSFMALDRRDQSRIESFAIEGFGTLSEYYNSGYVELLTFEGDFYDVDSGEVLENQSIVVADRTVVLSRRTNPSWLGKCNKRAVVWRPRPDNLLGMGPLDNLIGLQYRIDHLENLKSDAFDQVAYPIIKIKGMVQDFEFEPGARITMGDDGEVSYLVPDGTFLQADNQIAILENAMEEMAGAPKTAMGIRTPGEKTAYEVQSLENAAGRIFQVKITQFERQLLEPIINLMVESGRRNLDTQQVVRRVDDDLGATLYETITKEDLKATGRLRPMGARHFAERAKLVQEITTFFAPGNIGADSGVRVHFSGKNIAKLFSDLLNLDSYNLYAENAQINESLETESLKNEAARSLQETAATETGLEGEAIGLSEEALMQQLAAGEVPTE